MRTKNNLLVHEFIGLKTEVIKSKSLPYVGLHGLVVDETKNVLVLRIGDDIKRVPKEGSVFRFFIDKDQVDINGSEICIRPENRIKKLLRKVTK